MWKYLGKAAQIGIPARDLTDEEAEKYGLKRVKACGLYKHIKKTATKKAKQRSVKHGRN